MTRRGISFCLIAVFAVLARPLPLDAQVPPVERAARRAVERELERKIVNVVGDAIACAVGNQECVDEAKANGETVVFVDDEGNVITDKDGNPIQDADAAQAATEQPGTGRWIDYDYLRGAIAMFNTWWNILDVENPPATVPNPEIRAGRIPSNILHRLGNMQFVHLDGIGALEISDRAVLQVVLDEPMSAERGFSVEVTFYTPGNGNLIVYFEPVVEAAGAERKFGDDRNKHFLELGRQMQISHAYNAGRDVASTRGIPAHEQFVTVEFQIDDGYALMYVGGERVAQIPNFTLPEGSNTIEFFTHASSRNPLYIADIRVDYGVDDPVEVFSAENEYVTRSIYFDFNSAELRPESTPELERIYEMLMEYGQPVEIHGHTDSIGSDEHNLELSQRRAESVKGYLVDKGVDPDLIIPIGDGEKEPVGDNETDEGRQLNRRVVVKPAM